MPGLLAQPMRDSDSAATAETTPAPPTTPAPAKGQMDPILTKVKEGVESKLPPDLQQGVQQVVVAGMKLLYDPSTHGQVQRIYDALAQGGFQPTAIATGMVNLLGMIAKGSKGKMPVQAAFPAGVILLVYVLDDLSHRGLKVTSDLVKEIAKQMKPLFTKAFGLDQGQPSPAAPPSSPPATPAPTQPAPTQGAA